MSVSGTLLPAPSSASWTRPSCPPSGEAARGLHNWSSEPEAEEYTESAWGIAPSLDVEGNGDEGPVGGGVGNCSSGFGSAARSTLSSLAVCERKSVNRRFFSGTSSPATVDRLNLDIAAVSAHEKMGSSGSVLLMSNFFSVRLAIRTTIENARRQIGECLG